MTLRLAQLRGERYLWPSQNRPDDLAADVGQAEIAAGMAERQPLVVEAQEMQDRRLQVVDVDRVFDDVKPEVVGRAVDNARLDAAAGHPHREGLRMVVAAEAALEDGMAFDHRRAAELAAPDHQRFVQQAALFEVLGPGRRRPGRSSRSSGGGCRSSRCGRPSLRDRC